MPLREKVNGFYLETLMCWITSPPVPIKAESSKFPVWIYPHHHPRLPPPLWDTCCCYGNYCFKGWTTIFPRPRLQTFIFQPVRMNKNSFQVSSLISYWPITVWLAQDEISSKEFLLLSGRPVTTRIVARWVEGGWGVGVCLPRTNTVWISAHWSVCKKEKVRKPACVLCARAQDERARA